MDEKIFSPVIENIQKTNSRKWHTDGFIEKTKDTSGVIVICKKTT